MNTLKIGKGYWKTKLHKLVQASTFFVCLYKDLSISRHQCKSPIVIVVATHSGHNYSLRTVPLNSCLVASDKLHQNQYDSDSGYNKTFVITTNDASG